jgi:hypothetical protein
MQLTIASTSLVARVAPAAGRRAPAARRVVTAAASRRVTTTRIPVTSLYHRHLPPRPSQLSNDVAQQQHFICRAHFICILQIAILRTAL